jgi:hypothetical protein
MLHSLSAQVSYYSGLIQSHEGWLYVGVYTDEAITGTKEQRDGFQRLMEDCREVLGIDEVTADALDSRLTAIRADKNNTLVFCFKDGEEIVKRWYDRSRSESWTDEMREAARNRIKAKTERLSSTKHKPYMCAVFTAILWLERPLGRLPMNLPPRVFQRPPDAKNGVLQLLKASSPMRNIKARHFSKRPSRLITYPRR